MTDWALGVDVAVGALDCCWISPTATYFHTRIEIKPGEDHGLQLALAQDAMRMRLQLYPIPWLAYVELPTGKFAKPRLMMTAGLACVAISKTGKAPSYLVPPPKWKKNIGLKGNASKADIMAWALSRGLPEDRTQDCADALGLATSAALDLGWGGASTLPLKEWGP